MACPGFGKGLADGSNGPVAVPAVGRGGMRHSERESGGSEGERPDRQTDQVNDGRRVLARGSATNGRAGVQDWRDRIGAALGGTDCENGFVQV